MRITTLSGYTVGGGPTRLRNIRSVTAIVRQQKVELLHAHSRASSWVGTFVSKFTGVPLVTTVHGIQHRHLSRKLFPAFGRTAIAVCANIREQLVMEMRLDTKHVVIIPNGIDLTRYSPLSSHSDSEPTLLFIGRLSGPKHQAVKRFIAEVMKDLLCRLPKARFTVVGRISDKEELEKEALPIWERFGRVSVSFLGYLDEVSPFLKLARLVMGSGRVVLEAMASGKPIVALGETDYLGVLTPDIFKSASESNFGDCSPREQINFAGAGKRLAEILGDEKRCSELGAWGREAVKTFDICWVADQVEGVYRRCLSSPS